MPPQKKNKHAVLEAIDYLTELIEQIQYRYEGGDIWEWIENNRVIFGEKWSWEYARIKFDPGEEDRKRLKLIESEGRYYLSRAPRPYLKKYINDMSPTKTVIKCRQSEFSEAEINSNLYEVCNKPYFNVRHLFPTTSVANQMAKEKIFAAINESENISRRVVKPYNLTQVKTDIDSFYTVAGAFNEYGGRGPSSDKIVFDEYNFHNPKIKEVYQASTDHSKYAGQKVYISTPTFPNMGIDEEFQSGSQNQWHVTCPKCGKVQVMSFPESLINFVEKGVAVSREQEEELLDKVYIGCKYCKAYIDRTTPKYEKTSFYVPVYPEREGKNPSYMVTGFMTPWRSGKEINARYLRMRFVQQFFNEVLGYAHIGESNRVTEGDVNKCVDKGWRNIFRKNNTIRNTSVGIDWGESESWIVVVGEGVDGMLRVVFAMRIARDTLKKYGFGELPDNHVELAMKVIDTFNPKIIVNDANGIGITHNAKLYRKFKDRSYGSFYDTNEGKQDAVSRSSVIVRWDESKGIVTVPRVVELTETMSIFQEGRVQIPVIETATMETFKKHIMSLASSYQMEDKSGKVRQIVGHVGPDHFAHAFTYARIGYERIATKGGDARTEKKIVRMSSGVS